MSTPMIPTTPRRLGLLACAAALSALMATLAGCGGEVTAAQTFRPVPFGKHDRCQVCGMVISHYEGPKAEVVIKGAEGEPVKFCSGRDAFSFARQPENERRLLAFFIHDMGATDWAEPSDDALIPAKDAWYVYGSKVEGVMGTEPIAFGTEAAAKAFQEKEGGKIVRYADVTLELLNE